jgi:hypothetical protein
MAVKLALFQSLGTCPSCIDLLNMIEIGITSDGRIALINLGPTYQDLVAYSFLRFEIDLLHLVLL